VSAPRGRDIVECWRQGPVAVEHYHCATNQIRVSERHSHEEYQFGLSSTDQASYRYRGATHRVSPGTISIIHSGEVHETYEHEIIPTTVVYEIVYASAAVLRTIASELLGREVAAPYFASAVIADRSVVASFRRFHDALRSDARLESDAALLQGCTTLFQRFAKTHPGIRKFTPSQPDVRRVAEYLNECYAHNLSLEELANVAKLSVSHFFAAFREEYGLPPHQFRLQIRIARAKQLILLGVPAAEVAIATGFAHQSHFGRHFKRIVGVSPDAFRPRQR
jgi:AraC-like DNA-binding protein